MTAASESASIPRSSGILLHPTSLPGPFGIGDLGSTALAWVDHLVGARQRWWQVLPLGPTGYADSPYQSPSAFAGNPNLISPELLHSDGLLTQQDLQGALLPDGPVDYDRVAASKKQLLARAYANFRAGVAGGLACDFEEFCQREAAWLDDFALFMALAARYGEPYLIWPRDLVRREPGALEGVRRELSEQVGLHQFVQFLFFRQWRSLKAYARQRGVSLIGDVAIFVSDNSADVWANPELFFLDKERRPIFIAGVPPDYFARTGQRWGNPLYDWAAMKLRGYAWWVARLRMALEQVDLIRLDHFRGFEAYWEIPAELPTAEVGRWVPGPGADLFATLRRELGALPLIAEDLGVITPEVDALRLGLGLPGMRVLQFAFGGATERRFLPHNYEANTVVYTGTHDNDTTVSWYANLTPQELCFYARYVRGGGQDPAWELIRLAWASVADLAVTPLQDILRLGHEARMNLPGKAEGNWRWRLGRDVSLEGPLAELADLTDVYDRAPAPPPAATANGGLPSGASGAA